LKKTEKNGVIFADQWNNLDNTKAHYVSTGPEIWDETGGKIDGFVCAVGSGGTLAGVSTFLKERTRRSRSASPIRAVRRCIISSTTARPKSRRVDRSPRALGLPASRPSSNR